MTWHPSRLPTGRVDLSKIPTDDVSGFDRGKKQGKAALFTMGDELADLQERLFAQGCTGSRRRLLLVLQGMDTSGKGGVLKHTVGLVDPQGVRIVSFKAPNEEEKEHDFLWRIRKAVPEPGYIGVFDRSHYEDVLIGRVRQLADAEEIERRYAAINDFERELVDDGVTVVKCMLHISPEQQRSRLLRRLHKPDKHWKYNPQDVDERAQWPRYREAYEIALERTNTEHAPWFVIPSDRKWYRNLMIGQILLNVLRSMDPEWPKADYDVEHERSRLQEESPVA